eukprot:TRINITY_DN2748_c0_g1_i3.p1 TRINITY_DN2748_c0_g1~~TRINITY_DN2748_c0_g1_i3.p1  ORF type:complete len:644 (-),score=183.27 TRINITY_DN2748_c0_g1_i3:1138-3069(-)
MKRKEEIFDILRKAYQTLEQLNAVAVHGKEEDIIILIKNQLNIGEMLIDLIKVINIEIINVNEGDERIKFFDIAIEIAFYCFSILHPSSLNRYIELIDNIYSFQSQLQIVCSQLIFNCIHLFNLILGTHPNIDVNFAMINAVVITNSMFSMGRIRVILSLYHLISADQAFFEINVDELFQKLLIQCFFCCYLVSFDFHDFELDNVWTKLLLEDENVKDQLDEQFLNFLNDIQRGCVEELLPVIPDTISLPDELFEDDNLCEDDQNTTFHSAGLDLKRILALYVPKDQMIASKEIQVNELNVEDSYLEFFQNIDNSYSSLNSSSLNEALEKLPIKKDKQNVVLPFSKYVTLMCCLTSSLTDFKWFNIVLDPLKDDFSKITIQWYLEKIKERIGNEITVELSDLIFPTTKLDIIDGKQRVFIFPCCYKPFDEEFHVYFEQQHPLLVYFDTFDIKIPEKTPKIFYELAKPPLPEYPEHLCKLTFDNDCNVIKIDILSQLNASIEYLQMFLTNIELFNNKIWTKFLCNVYFNQIFDNLNILGYKAIKTLIQIIRIREDTLIGIFSGFVRGKFAVFASQIKKLNPELRKIVENVLKDPNLIQAKNLIFKTKIPLHPLDKQTFNELKILIELFKETNNLLKKFQMDFST